jgi:hypothetical protein
MLASESMADVWIDDYNVARQKRRQNKSWQLVPIQA